MFDALRGANAALCQAESETLETPQVRTADFVYFRLRKESYSEERRSALALKVGQLARDTDVFTYFKHEETAEGAMYAESLLAGARELVAGWQKASGPPASDAERTRATERAATLGPCTLGRSEAISLKFAAAL